MRFNVLKLLETILYLFRTGGTW